MWHLYEWSKGNFAKINGWYGSKHGLRAKLLWFIVWWCLFVWNLTLLVVTVALIGPLGFAIAWLTRWLRGLRPALAGRVQQGGFGGKVVWGSVWLFVSSLLAVVVVFDWILTLSEWSGQE
jgi:hypothetical protein